MPYLYANAIDRNAGRIILPPPPPDGLPPAWAAYFKRLHQTVVDTFNSDQRNWQRLKLKEDQEVLYVEEWLVNLDYKGTDNVTGTIDSTRDWRIYNFLVEFRAADSAADLANLGNGNDGNNDTGFQTPQGTTQNIAQLTINNCTVRVGCNPTTGYLEYSVTNSSGGASRTVFMRIWAAVPATAELTDATYTQIGNRA